MEVIATRRIKTKKKTVELYINYLLTVVFSIVQLTPYLSRNLRAYYCFGIFCAWILSVFLLANRFSDFLSNKLFLLGCVLFFYQLVYSIIGLSTIKLQTVVIRLSIFLIPYGFYVINSRYSIRFLFFLFASIITILLINLVSNLMLFSQYSADYLSAVGDFDLGGTANLTNAGDTSFVFDISLVLICFFMIFLNIKKIKTRVISICIVATCFYYLVFLNQRATTIILLLFTAFALFLCSFGIKKGTINSKRVIIVLLLAIIFIAEIKNLLIWIGNNIQGKWINEKINDLIRLFEGNGSVVSDYGSLAVRIEFALLSLKTFSKSIVTVLFGIGEQYVPSGTYYYLMQSGVGGHSEFVDLLAEYGLLGAVIMFYSIKEVIKHQFYKLKTNELKIQFVIITTYILAYGFLNNFIYGSSMILISFILPFSFFLCDQYTKGSVK